MVAQAGEKDLLKATKSLMMEEVVFDESSNFIMQVDPGYFFLAYCDLGRMWA
jgi:hypothetical protein